ncbi:MAG: hypothetical protein VKJ64_06740, partial [Leptolyngbyaceae bacterium]|nr:hypothetical protein [Leptolyngbyaceae bacterium]
QDSVAQDSVIDLTASPTDADGRTGYPMASMASPISDYPSSNNTMQLSGVEQGYTPTEWSSIEALLQDSVPPEPPNGSMAQVDAPPLPPPVPPDLPSKPPSEASPRAIAPELPEQQPLQRQEGGDHPYNHARVTSLVPERAEDSPNVPQPSPTPVDSWLPSPPIQIQRTPSPTYEPLPELTTLQQRQTRSPQASPPIPSPESTLGLPHQIPGIQADTRRLQRDDNGAPAPPATVTGTTDQASKTTSASPSSLDALARAIYYHVRQRLRLERERNGNHYRGRF